MIGIRREGNGHNLRNGNIEACKGTKTPVVIGIRREGNGHNWRNGNTEVCKGTKIPVVTATSK